MICLGETVALCVGSRRDEERWVAEEYTRCCQCMLQLESTMEMRIKQVYEVGLKCVMWGKLKGERVEEANLCLGMWLLTRQRAPGPDVRTTTPKCCCETSDVSLLFDCPNRAANCIVFRLILLQMDDWAIEA